MLIRLISASSRSSSRNLSRSCSARLRSVISVTAPMRNALSGSSPAARCATALRYLTAPLGINRRCSALKPLRSGGHLARDGEPSCVTTRRTLPPWTGCSNYRFDLLDEAPDYLIRDRNRIYGSVVVTRRLRATGIRDKPTAPASPWQNGFAERLIGSSRPRFRAVAVSSTSSQHTIRGRCYCVRNLYATIRATMLAKISSARRDFRIVGLVEWRAADSPG